jgi:hypothetical protein
MKRYSKSSIMKKGILNPLALSVFILLVVIDIILLYLQLIPIEVYVIGFVLALFIAAAIYIADQWERAVVLRMGKFKGLKGPGPFLIIPIVDRIAYYVDQRVRVTDFKAEETLTKDTVPVNVSSALESMNLGAVGGFAALADSYGSASRKNEAEQEQQNIGNPKI